jgi:xanthine dehydrogenase accessory factor
MREIAQDLRRWWEAGIPFALATVTDVRRSTPRQPGAAMAVAETGEVSGSVSGGCVEGAVVEVGQGVLASGRATAVSYGYSDEEAFAVGLTCGGELDLVVRRVDGAGMPFFASLLERLERHEPVAIALVTDGDGVGAALMVTPETVEGSLGHDGLDAAVVDDARGMLAQGTTGQRRYGPAGERRQDDVGVFVAAFVPPPRMLVFGAIDYAAAVARVGKFLGYAVTVCDAREVFATRRRFPDADEVVVEWPHRYLERTAVDERTVVCVLTHDPKFDVPLLEVALRTPAAYVGAMGSRRTHDDRLARLREAGLAEEELVRLHSPIGLDLGARTPEETAVSIAAEIIQRRWGGSGLPLRATGGRIHSEAAEPVVRA